MKLSQQLGESWAEALGEELRQPYLKELAYFIKTERQQAVYPPAGMVFNAFKYTPYKDVNVVIVGQDPYHGEGQAHGLAFSVPRGVEPPPSLKNIFKEIGEDVGLPSPPHGCLTSWAAQGVFLLNTVLTVRAKEPLSHQNQGWERFTDSVIGALARRHEPIVFMLWGSFAQKKCHKIEALFPRHVVLRAPHPSPLSAYQGFFGCRHFSKANAYLTKWGRTPIDWGLSP